MRRALAAVSLLGLAASGCFLLASHQRSADEWKRETFPQETQ